MGKDESLLRLSQDITELWKGIYELKDQLEKIYKEVYGTPIIIMVDPRFYDNMPDDNECNLLFPEP